VRKQTIQYSSPLDALIVVAKRLSTYENRQQMGSEEFFDRYSKGQLSDVALFIEWANDYRHYLALRREIEKRLQHCCMRSWRTAAKRWGIWSDGCGRMGN
jgi:hypothetical protein